MFNECMSAVRSSVEWLFGDIVNYFKFLDFKKNLKIGLSQVGKMYIVCSILRNGLTCLFSNTTAEFFWTRSTFINRTLSQWTFHENNITFFAYNSCDRNASLRVLCVKISLICDQPSPCESQTLGLEHVVFYLATVSKVSCMFSSPRINSDRDRYGLTKISKQQM